MAESIDFQIRMKNACTKEIGSFCRNVPHGHARVIRSPHQHPLLLSALSSVSACTDSELEGYTSVRPCSLELLCCDCMFACNKAAASGTLHHHNSPDKPDEKQTHHLFRISASTLVKPLYDSRLVTVATASHKDSTHIYLQLAWVCAGVYRTTVRRTTSHKAAKLKSRSMSRLRQQTTGIC